MLHLSHADTGTPLRVSSIEGGHDVRSRLATIGVLPGVVLEVVTRGPWGGPILVEVDGTRVALGRGVAEKVLVEP